MGKVKVQSTHAQQYQYQDHSVGHRHELHDIDAIGSTLSRSNPLIDSYQYVTTVKGEKWHHIEDTYKDIDAHQEPQNCGPSTRSRICGITNDSHR
jgi:hypothetical protein